MTTANQRMSNKHEDEVAEAFGGQVTPMSGAGWVSKNDVRTDAELIECKATGNLSYTVRYRLMDELYRAGLQCSKRAVLHVKLAPGGMRPKRLVVLAEDDYLALSQKAGER